MQLDLYFRILSVTIETLCVFGVAACVCRLLCALAFYYYRNK